ncbi:MAG: RidA family protein [Candidatus Methylacidiphilales bacterium]|nr:RidA family protein [Candidatus Methylacidiphilales bacterium]
MSHKRSVSPAGGPQAVGPYSMAIRSGDLVFTAGQIPLDPASGEITGKTVAEQTRRVLLNLKAVLLAAGCTPDDVLKTTVFLTDLAAFAEMNTVYAEFFREPHPARSTIQVSALPKGALVEIEAVARVNAA